MRWNPDTDEGFWFAGFSEEPREIYVTRESDAGRWAIYSYDLAEKKLGEMVFGHPEFDAVRSGYGTTGLSNHTQDGRLLSVAYANDDSKLHFVDPEMERIQSVIDGVLPGKINRIYDWDRDYKVALVHSSSDTAPPRYYLFDRKGEGVKLISNTYPELERAEFSPMQAIEYEARDGLAIHGYLTLPVGAGAGPHPTIVYPHGGPWARDVRGWNAIVQFLASRGYAVFQPNFRGSRGYGRDFERKGYGQWGLAMQDDITDGARWLIEEGIADPERLGIYGSGFGGYIASRALQKEPDLFNAGASVSGMSDVLVMLNNHSPRSREILEELVGDRWSDRKRLAAVSPARHADEILAPVLIAHGTNDPVFWTEHAEEMIDALEAAGVEHEAYLYDGEVHGFVDERNRIDFYTKLAAFFERHLAKPQP